MHLLKKTNTKDIAITTDDALSSLNYFIYQGSTGNRLARTSSHLWSFQFEHQHLLNQHKVRLFLIFEFVFLSLHAQQDPKYRILYSN